MAAGKKLHSKIISFANQKGGVGKSTMASLLASSLSENYKVLLLDLDHQGSLQMLNADRNLKYDFEYFDPENKFERIRERLVEADGKYDFIFMDTPGKFDAHKSIGEQEVLRHISYSDYVIVPVEPTEMSFNTTVDFLRNVYNFIENHELDTHFVLSLNKTAAKEKLTRSLTTQLNTIDTKGKKMSIMQTGLRRYTAFADISPEKSYLNPNGNAAQMNASLWINELLKIVAK